MSESETDNRPGVIAWCDLTVADAAPVRDFYAGVVGWQAEGLDMGGYEDYCMKPKGGETAAGICHARGKNKEIPPVWMVYINVPVLEDALEKVEELGGEILLQPGDEQKHAIIRDPAGAVCALYGERRS